MKTTDILALGVTLLAAAVAAVSAPWTWAIWLAAALLAVGVVVLALGFRKLIGAAMAQYQNLQQTCWNHLDNIQQALSDSREDHQTALQQVSSQMEQLVQALQSQIEHQEQTEALIKELTTLLETCHQEQVQQYQAQETQRHDWADSQAEQTDRIYTAAGEIQKAVWQLQQNSGEGQAVLLKALNNQIERQKQSEALVKGLTALLEKFHQDQESRLHTAAGEIQNAVQQLQQNNSEGQSILLKALDRLDRNGIQKLLVSMEDQAENQSDLIDEVKALQKQSRDSAGRMEALTERSDGNVRRQLELLKGFLEQEGKKNREHSDQLADVYAQLTAQDMQALQQLREKSNG